MFWYCVRFPSLLWNTWNRLICSWLLKEIDRLLKTLGGAIYLLIIIVVVAVVMMMIMIMIINMIVIIIIHPPHLRYIAVQTGIMLRETYFWLSKNASYAVIYHNPLNHLIINRNCELPEIWRQLTNTFRDILDTQTWPPSDPTTFYAWAGHSKKTHQRAIFHDFRLSGTWHLAAMIIWRSDPGFTSGNI